MRKLYWIRLLYWLVCSALGTSAVMNVSWWVHYHHWLNAGGWLGILMGAPVMAAVLARRDVRGR